MAALVRQPLNRRASCPTSSHDGGPGIAKESRERVFERFERLVSASDVSGFGLGLYIVREIVQAHGGTIHLGDQQAGARFVIRLPLKPPASDQRAADAK